MKILSLLKYEIWVARGEGSDVRKNVTTVWMLYRKFTVELGAEFSACHGIFAQMYVADIPLENV